MKFKVILLVLFLTPSLSVASVQCKSLFAKKSIFSTLKSTLSFGKKDSKEQSLNSSYFKDVLKVAKNGDPIEFDSIPLEGLASKDWQPNAEKLEPLLKSSEYTAQEKLEKITADYFAFHYINLKPKKTKQIEKEIDKIMNGKQNISPGLNIFLRSMNKITRLKTQLGFKGEEAIVAADSIGELLKVFHFSQAMNHKNRNINFLQYGSMRAVESLTALVNLSKFGSNIHMKVQVAQAIKDTVDYTRKLPEEVIETMKQELSSKLEASKNPSDSNMRMHLFLKQILTDASGAKKIDLSNYNNFIYKPAFANMMIRFVLINNFLINTYLAYSSAVYDPTIIGFDLSAIYGLLTLF